MLEIKSDHTKKTVEMSAIGEERDLFHEFAQAVSVFVTTMLQTESTEAGLKRKTTLIIATFFNGLKSGVENRKKELK